jgi:hypothetical protein
MPTKATTLRVETPLLSCTKAWCFYSWDNGDIWLQTILQIAPHVLWIQGYTMHKKSYDVLNYTMHTKMSMLKKWRRTKGSVVTPNYFNISYFRNPKPFSLCGFAFMQLISWTLALITWSLFYFIWIGWQRELKLSLCTTYSVLFVTVCLSFD